MLKNQSLMMSNWKFSSQLLLTHLYLPFCVLVAVWLTGWSSVTLCLNVSLSLSLSKTDSTAYKAEIGK